MSSSRKVSALVRLITLSMICAGTKAQTAAPEKTRREECHWQTLLAGGEQGHRTVGLVRCNGKTEADRRFRRHCLHRDLEPRDG